MFRFRSRLHHGGGVACGIAGPALTAWLGAAMLGAVLVAVSLPGVMAADPAPADDGTKPAAAGKPLRFTDEDLERFRKPAPAAPEAEGPAPTGDAPAPKPAAVPAAGKGAPGPKPAPPATLAPVPRPAPGATPTTLAPPAAPLRPAAATAPLPAAAAQGRAKPPADDPLKPWKDREELETFRAEQLRTLRARISGLESRLEYLNLKRLSILDPTRIMPMPQTDEDRTADHGKGSRDLLADVDRQIETAESDLKEAKEDLIAIETRFARESGLP